MRDTLLAVDKYKNCGNSVSMYSKNFIASDDSLNVYGGFALNVLGNENDTTDSFYDEDISGSFFAVLMENLQYLPESSFMVLSFSTKPDS